MEQYRHPPRPAVLAGLGPAVDLPIVHDSDRYDFIRDIGSGKFGVARLMRDRITGELVAVKYIERGEKVKRVSPFIVDELAGCLVVVIGTNKVCSTLELEGL